MLAQCLRTQASRRWTGWAVLQSHNWNFKIFWCLICRGWICPCI